MDLKARLTNRPALAHDVLRFTMALVFLSHTITRMLTKRDDHRGPDRPGAYRAFRTRSSVPNAE